MKTQGMGQEQQMNPITNLPLLVCMCCCLRAMFACLANVPFCFTLPYLFYLSQAPLYLALLYLSYIMLSNVMVIGRYTLELGTWNQGFTLCSMHVGIILPFACLSMNISIATSIVVVGAIATFINPPTFYLSHQLCKLPRCKKQSKIMPSHSQEKLSSVGLHQQLHLLKTFYLLN